MPKEARKYTPRHAGFALDTPWHTSIVDMEFLVALEPEHGNPAHDECHATQPLESDRTFRHAHQTDVIAYQSRETLPADHQRDGVCRAEPRKNEDARGDD